MKQAAVLRTIKVNNEDYTITVLSGGEQEENVVSRQWYGRNLTNERMADLLASILINDSQVRGYAIEQYISYIRPESLKTTFEVDFNGEIKSTDLLSFALENKQAPILSTLVTCLLKSGTSAMPTLFSLAKNNQWDQVHSALEKHSPTITNDLSSIEGGHTLLHYALNAGRKTVADTLINLGTKCDIQNKYNKLPLHIATATGQSEIAEKLYNKYPEALEHEDAQGRTPLYYAAGKLRDSSYFKKATSYVEMVTQSRSEPFIQLTK